MKIISNTAFGGERPLFESHDLRMENVVIWRISHQGMQQHRSC